VRLAEILSSGPESAPFVNWIAFEMVTRGLRVSFLNWICRQTHWHDVGVIMAVPQY